MAIDETILISKKYYEEVTRVSTELGQLDNDPRYSDDFKKQQRAVIIRQLNDKRRATINEVEPIFNRRIKAAEDAQKMKLAGTDRQLLVQNALLTLQLLDDRLTIHELRNIVAPFLAAEDTHTLQTIKTIANRYISSAELATVDFGENMRGEVFRHSQMRDLILESLKQELANNFTSGSSLNYAMGLRMFAVPLGYASAGDKL